jgi:hypothetical protein
MMTGDWPLDRKSGATGFFSIVEPLQYQKQPIYGVAISVLRDDTGLALSDKLTVIMRSNVPSAQPI